jgi:predicted acetyltransferase
LDYFHREIYLILELNTNAKEKSYFRRGFMEGPRQCKTEELQGVIELINNTFRTVAGLRPTMGDEFPLLLSENNLENMRIIVEDGKPVANLNYYETNIFIQGIPIRAASIGAVCTDKDYMKRGYSSLLLDDSERSMVEAGVDVLLVSGGRSLYTRRGCCHVENSFTFEVFPEGNKCEEFELMIYKDELLNEMLKLYSNEATRFYRSNCEFVHLLKGATTPWGNFTYQTYLACDNAEFLAYAVVRTVNNEEKHGELVECAGDRKIVLEMLKEIAKDNGLKHIVVQLPNNDSMYLLAKSKGLRINHINTQGTIKIMNFKALMNKLNMYFKQFVKDEIVNNLSYEVVGGTFDISLGNEKLQITDMQGLIELIFLGTLSNDVNAGAIPMLTDFINAVFPIPFVWTANLNYQ